MPFFLMIILAIWIESNGSVIYKQKRVGLNRVEFNIFKFRTMKQNSDKEGLLTIGSTDRRVTDVGFVLRKTKLDELPQLFNVLIGNMSLVGPRPEVKKFVDLYDEEQLQILSVKPGITDYASIEFADESTILETFEEPEKGYVNEIMPKKLALNLEYIKNRSLGGDFKIILLTLLRIFKKK